jgi:CMP/dCMP kinase
MSQKLIVAIDGPAGSGKSTSAKLVANKLSYLYIDTGAMYRAITYLVQKNALTNIDEITRLAEESELDLKFDNGITNVKINGDDVTDKIRDISINKKVSEISKIEGVRKALVKKQQAMAKIGRGVVMEGRDISTVVFPNADVKIFLTASIEQRSQRRAKEYAEKGTVVTVEEIKNNLLQRDKIDSTREVSPLVKASDAIEIDTSKVTIEEQVNIILNQIRIAANRKGIKVPI